MTFSNQDIAQFMHSSRKLLQQHDSLHSVSFGFQPDEKLAIFVSFTPPIFLEKGVPPLIYADRSNFPTAFQELPIIQENRLLGATPNSCEAGGPVDRGDVQCELRPGLDIAPVPDEGELHPRRGTLGCIVYDKVTGDAMILSNWHVMSGSTSLVIQPSTLLMKPPVAGSSTAEANGHSQLCAKIMRSSVDYDCAAAVPIHRTVNTKMLGLGVTPKDAKMPELNDPVVKFGAGNNRSYGIVKRIGVVRMNFGGAFADTLLPCCYIARDEAVGQFEDEKQTKERELVRPGDSGCVWMLREKMLERKAMVRLLDIITQDPASETMVKEGDSKPSPSQYLKGAVEKQRPASDPEPRTEPYLRATETAVGLHFGADDAVEEFALAIPMPMVLEQLNVSLVWPPPAEPKPAAN